MPIIQKVTEPSKIVTCGQVLKTLTVWIKEIIYDNTYIS